MKALTLFLRDTVVGGVMFLVPIVVLVAILGKAHDISMKIVTPLAAAGAGAPRLLAILLIVFFCFAAGLFARTSAARRAGDWLEGTILSRIPGYAFMKGMMESLVGADRAQTHEVVLVRIEDAWQFAFLMDRIEPDHVAVFVPGAPDPKSGSVYFLTEDRIRPIDVTLAAAMERLRYGGRGSGPVLRGKL